MGQRTIAHRPGSPLRDARLHPAEGTQLSEARPVPTRQNSRFWMSATSRAVIVRGAPNESGSVRVAQIRGLITQRDEDPSHIKEPADQAPARSSGLGLQARPEHPGLR